MIITLIPGDGIGPEVTRAVVTVRAAAEHVTATTTSFADAIAHALSSQQRIRGY